VWIFTRTITPDLISLIKQLEREAALRVGDSALNILVIFVGPKREPLDQLSEQLASELSGDHVVIAIPKRFDIGDRKLNLNPDFETTILVNVERRVGANFALRAGELTPDRSREIVSSVKEVSSLKELAR
jgi:hypothetical protein